MDSIFGLDSASCHDEGLELLTTLYDEVSQSYVETILKDAEIPYLVKQRGSGSSVRIIMGYSIFGSDVYVRAQDLDTATALIAPVEQENEEVEQ